MVDGVGGPPRQGSTLFLVGKDGFWMGVVDGPLINMCGIGSFSPSILCFCGYW